MHRFVVAAAQVGSVKGDVDANVATHLRAMEKAASFGVSMLVFPELSLTGYERELGGQLAFTESDPRLRRSRRRRWRLK